MRSPPRRRRSSASVDPPRERLAADDLARVAEELFADAPTTHAPAAEPPPVAVSPPAAASPPAVPVPAARASAPASAPAPVPSRRPGRPPAGPRRSRTPRTRERTGDLLVLGGGVLLALSLFMPWSHQLSPAMLRAFLGTPALRGVPAAPDAWQVYSVVDLLLAALALALIAVATVGGRRARLITAAAVMVALAFAAHALATPPTEGTNLVAGALSPVRYVPDRASSGTGELVALAALGAALAGLAISPG